MEIKCIFECKNLTDHWLHLVTQKDSVQTSTVVEIKAAFISTAKIKIGPNFHKNSTNFQGSFFFHVFSTLKHYFKANNSTASS